MIQAAARRHRADVTLMDLIRCRSLLGEARTHKDAVDGAWNMEGVSRTQVHW